MNRSRFLYLKILLGVVAAVVIGYFALLFIIVMSCLVDPFC